MEKLNKTQLDKAVKDAFLADPSVLIGPDAKPVGKSGYEIAVPVTVNDGENDIVACVRVAVTACNRTKTDKTEPFDIDAAHEKYLADEQEKADKAAARAALSAKSKKAKVTDTSAE